MLKLNLVIVKGVFLSSRTNIPSDTIFQVRGDIGKRLLL